MNNQDGGRETGPTVIPYEAIVAASRTVDDEAYALIGWSGIRLMLEAAAPHMLSYEREQTRLAHLDAMVNRDTADKLQRAVDRVEALADTMSEQPEHRTTAARIREALQGRWQE